MSDDISVEEAWETSTGLLDEFRGKINEAWFEFDEDYNNGETLVLKIKAASEDADDGIVEEMFSCGDGWTTDKKGENAKRDNGKKPIFNNRSAVGILIDSFKEAADEDQIKAMQKKGRPTEARVWVGMDATFKRHSYSFINKKGEEQSYSRLKIEEVHDVGGKASSAAKAKAKPEPADPDADEGNSSDGVKIPAKIKLALKKAAKENADDHDAFLEAAMDVDGVSDVEGLEDYLADDGEDGFWQQNRG